MTEVIGDTIFCTKVESVRLLKFTICIPILNQFTFNEVSDDRSEDEELDTVRSRSQDKCGLHGSLTQVKFYIYDFIFVVCLF